MIEKKTLMAACLLAQVLYATAIGFNEAKDMMSSNPNKFRNMVASGQIDANMEGPICNRSLLTWAAQRGLMVATEALLQNGANVNYRDKRRSKTPLMYALEFGQEALVKTLMNAGAKPEMQDYQGQTGYDYARKYNYSL